MVPGKEIYKLAKTILFRIFGENNSNNNYTEETGETESVEDV